MWFCLMIDKVKYLWLHAIYQSNVWFQEVLPLSTFYSERVYPIWTLHSSKLSSESSLYSLLVLNVPYGNWILLHCSKNNSKPISVNIKVANVKSNFKNDEAYLGKHLSCLWISIKKNIILISSVVPQSSLFASYDNYSENLYKEF